MHAPGTGWLCVFRFVDELDFRSARFGCIDRENAGISLLAFTPIVTFEINCQIIGLECSFHVSEGVLAYSIPQGMVRGAMLELMDHTYDGHEDSVSGDLRGGLGQLVDGHYGLDDFKASGRVGLKGKHVAWFCV